MKIKWLVGMLVIVMCLLGSSVGIAKVELTHWHNTVGPLRQVDDTMLAEEFMKLHPEVDIEVTEVVSNMLATKIAAAVLGEVPPTTTRDYLGRLAAWANQGLLVDLTGTLSQEDLDDFYPAVLVGLTINGKLIGYPTALWLQTYLVNQTILDKAGVAFPKGVWTLVDWISAAAKVKAIGYWPTVFFFADHGGDYLTLTNLGVYGATLWENNDHTQTTLNSPTGTKALQWMVGIEKLAYAPPGSVGRHVVPYMEMFNSGQVAMASMTLRQATLGFRQDVLAKEQVSELQDIRVVETPRFGDSLGLGLPYGPNGVVVFKNDNPEVVKWAINWAQFLTNKENGDFQAISDTQFAPRQSSNPHADNKAFSDALALVVKYGLYDCGMGSPYYLEVRKLLPPQTQAAFLGTKTAQEALDDFAASIVALWE